MTLVRPRQVTFSKQGGRQERIAVNIVFILFGLTAALSMALNIFLVPLLEAQINQEMLIAQTALRQNEFFCRARQKRSI